MTYAEYYKAKLESGLLYQDFVVDAAWHLLGLAIVQYSSKAYQQSVGESRTGVEIKHDEKFSETGNLWIEIEEKASQRPGPYVQSGIYRVDNCWLYVIGNYDIIFFFSKRWLQQLHKSDRYRTIENNTKTLRGFLFCEKDAKRYGVVILEPNAETKVAKLTFDLAKAGKELHQMLLEKPGQMTLFR